MAGRIGTRAHASMARDIDAGDGDGDKDWEYLSGGSCRSVLLHLPTNVVYKVDTWKPDGYSNSAEVRTARVLRKEQWDHVRIPALSEYKFGKDSVVAMEYVEGSLGSDVARSHNYPAREEMFNKGRLEDMHGNNFKFEAKTGKLVPIDLGAPRARSIHGADKRVLNCGDGSCWG